MLLSPPRIGTVRHVMGVVLIVVGDLLYVGSHGRISAGVWLGLVGFCGCLALIGLAVAIRRRGPADRVDGTASGFGIGGHLDCDRVSHIPTALANPSWIWPGLGQLS